MKKILALIVAIMMLSAMMVGAMAASDFSQGKVGSGGNNAAILTGEAINIQKVLTAYNKDETSIYAPTFSYTYVVTSGSANKRITDDANPGVSVLTKAGILNGLSVTGSTDGNATAATVGTSESQSLTNTIAWTNATTLTAADNGASNTQNLVLDFSNVNFTAAGVYRYVITEKPGNAENATTTASAYASAGITDGNASNHVRYLDVYVKDGAGENAGAWDVYGFVCSDSDGDLTSQSTSKTNGFMNDSYYTYNVTVSKTLVNDAANNDHDFPFTVNFTNSSVTQPVKVRTTTVENGAAALAGSDLTGTLSTATTGVQDSPSIDHQSNKKYIGIPVGVTAATATTVHERNDVTGTTYTSVYSVDSATAAGSKQLSWGENETVAAAISNNATVTPTANVDDDTSHTVAFTNTLDIISPTGVALRFGPYIIMAGAAIALLVIMARRRKDTQDKDNAI